MADVLHLNDYRSSLLHPGCTDGGKGRILSQRAMRMRIDAQPKRDVADDLMMDHADPADAGMPSDVAPY